MIIGALPFSVVMLLMAISLIKAVVRDGMRARHASKTPAE
jgi:choline-glycine betaine transporter